MNIVDQIKNIASFLEDENNEFFKKASDEDLGKIATGFFEAASSLRKMANEIASIDAPSSSENDLVFSETTLEEIGAIAEAFDNSGDEELQKQASVLDELLLSIAAPRDYVANYRALEEAKIDELKKKYQDLKYKSDKFNDKAATLVALDKSDIYKDRKPNIALLSSRACPEHGMPMYRVGPTSEGSIWQCSLDHKVFNYEEGFTLADGTKVEPRHIADQNSTFEPVSYQIFDNREQRTGGRV